MSSEHVRPVTESASRRRARRPWWRPRLLELRGRDLAVGARGEVDGIGAASGACDDGGAAVALDGELGARRQGPARRGRRRAASGRGTASSGGRRAGRPWRRGRGRRRGATGGRGARWRARDSASPVTANTAPPDWRARSARRGAVGAGEPGLVREQGGRRRRRRARGRARGRCPRPRWRRRRRGGTRRGAGPAAGAGDRRARSHAGRAASASAAPRSVAPSSASVPANESSASTLARRVLDVGVPVPVRVDAEEQHVEAAERVAVLVEHRAEELQPHVEPVGVRAERGVDEEHGGVVAAGGRGVGQRGRDLRREHVAEAGLAAGDQRRAGALEPHGDRALRGALEVEPLPPGAPRGAAATRGPAPARAGGGRHGDRGLRGRGDADVDHRAGHPLGQIEPVLERVADPDEIDVVPDDDPVELAGLEREHARVEHAGAGPLDERGVDRGAGRSGCTRARPARAGPCAPPSARAEPRCGRP